MYCLSVCLSFKCKPLYVADIEATRFSHYSPPTASSCSIWSSCSHRVSNDFRVVDPETQVVTKTCFSMTLRGRNRPRLVQHGLPALCGKVMKASIIMMIKCLYMVVYLAGDGHQFMVTKRTKVRCATTRFAVAREPHVSCYRVQGAGPWEEGCRTRG